MGKTRISASGLLWRSDYCAVFVHNEGGLAVDHEHHVLGAGDKPIAGLYAAGSTGQGGMLLKGHGHHLGWAFVSGRRAGRNAALAAMTN